MSGYGVVIAALRKSAGAVRSAGEQAAVVDLAGTVAGVPGALAGSRSAASASALSQAWRTQVREWSNSAIALGDNMSGAAGRYEKNEQEAKENLTLSWPGSRFF
ncbi:hypothetical protein [Actinokineospora sp. NBRC 105648]|uniref:hypothetical protein n=1 Tax=Actinokineospora sp. NBRC 105648 TaxID=3032206 RepID=UPI0024A03B03|nr:hypothetical protein [Actinokineospora sp. NBRC 105648]GLZ37681.1 hypothetical protein Acsp05_13060 [Actinokineospora sp. NBRC 105648]